MEPPSKPPSGAIAEKLRQKAEDALRDRIEKLPRPFSQSEALHLLHELEVHRVEIEIQNEELRDTIREMEHSREEYCRLYEDAPIAYLTIDERGVIVRANGMALALLGARGDGIIGRGVSLFVHPKDHGIYYSLLLRCSKSSVRQSGRFRLLQRGGGCLHAQVEIVTARDLHGRFDGWRIAFLDVSERVRAEERLKVYAGKLEQSNRDLQDFAFIASHDLQEPLRKIRIFGDRLKTACGDALNERGTDALARMCNAAGRLQEMVRGLLDYSRVGSASNPFERVDLNVVARGALSDLQVRIETVGAAIEVDLLPAVEGDPFQLRQLFQNLINNALKFRREVPCVVRIHADPASDGEDDPPEENETGTCRILVEDNGIGFEAHHAERIFSLFERLHGHGQYEGTGLGLSICRRIVERHGGAIRAEGKSGVGATFIITLRTAEPGIKDDEPPAEQPS